MNYCQVLLSAKAYKNHTLLFKNVLSDINQYYQFQNVSNSILYFKLQIFEFKMSMIVITVAQNCLKSTPKAYLKIVNFLNSVARFQNSMYKFINSICIEMYS